MKDLSKDIIDMMTEASGRLAQVVANSSFEFWQRKDFRLYVNFDAISQTEQDRMFNEVEVSVLGLFHLYFDDALLQVDEPEKIVLSTFQNELTPAFMKIMKDIGIQKKYLDIWEKLIAMRLKEYREDFKIADKESRSQKDLKMMNMYVSHGRG